MISYISGILKYKGADFVIVENGGIGFRIFASADTVSRLPASENEVRLYTHMNVREDDISLFGFMTMEELNMFDRLITVKGVGPKGATALLASLSPAEISLAVITDDIKTLSSGHGIGKKTAQQIILDLKGRIETKEAEGASVVGAAVKNSEKAEAEEALLALGFAVNEAQKALDAVYDENLTVSELIGRALKLL